MALIDNCIHISLLCYSATVLWLAMRWRIHYISWVMNQLVRRAVANIIAAVVAFIAVYQLQIPTSEAHPNLRQVSQSTLLLYTYKNSIQLIY